jgi:hypothetical protein
MRRNAVASANSLRNLRRIIKRRLTMDLTPPEEETPKDYATRRIDLDQPESASEPAAPEVEKKNRTRKTAERRAVTTPIEAVVAAPVEEQLLRAAPAPAPTAAPLPVAPLPPHASRNERVWIAAIIGICIVTLSCICACTIIATAFLNNPPW